MYTNCYYQREKNLIHLWDSKLGYRNFPYTRYAYKLDNNGSHISLYGDGLSKVYSFSKHDEGLFESDVPETTRVLVDMYYDDDMPSDGHTILTYDIEVEMETGLPDTALAENTITAISLHDSVANDYHVLILDLDGKIEKRQIDNVNILPFSTERDLLLAYLDIYESINPTIVTGWNIDDFDTPYLYNRLKRLFGERVANRLSPIGVCNWSNFRKRYFMAGVSYLDHLALYKNFTYTELDNYRLDSIAKRELGRGKVEYVGNLDLLFSTDINKFIEYVLTDTELVVALNNKLHFIETACGICHAGHVPYEDFIYSSKYLEGAILTYLKKLNIVAPNKPAEGRSQMAAIKNNEEEKFTGAYVKEPIPGKYDWIYDLDLTSLYPSIIMSLNISPETLVGVVENWDLRGYMNGNMQEFNINGKILSRDEFVKLIDANKFSIAANGALYRTDVVGCLPAILDVWFSQRMEFRKLEKKAASENNTVLYRFYNQRQLIQKILLNSLYGVLGLPIFRFYNKTNAEAVTITGQSIIKTTADVANLRYNKELDTSDTDHVVYIDTDSIFVSALPLLNHRYGDKWIVWDDSQIAVEVDKIAGEIQDYINSFYDAFAQRGFNLSKHRFEIKKEYISRSAIWVAKKRYAQWIIANNGIQVDKLDVKGLDVVRSSYPVAFREFMSSILVDILKGADEKTTSTRIQEYRKQLEGVSIADIAKNSSVKELSKYNIKNRVKLFEFPLGTPAHVKAAIAYNQMLSMLSLDNQYSKIKDGDKIKWAYLKPNPYGLDGIAFNGYNDPDGIIEYIQSYIDYDKIFERELENKLQDFYDALNWGTMVSKTTTADKFFSF